MLLYSFRHEVPANKDLNTDSYDAQANIVNMSCGF